MTRLSRSKVLVLLASVAAFSVPRVLGLSGKDCEKLYFQGRWAKAIHCNHISCSEIPTFCRSTRGNITDCHAPVDIPQFVNGVYLEMWQVCPRACDMCRDGNASSATAVEAAIGEPCEGGWEYVSGVCLKHFVVEDLDWRGRPLVTWYDAQDRCRQEGAQLANVDAAPHRHVALELVRRRPRDLHGLAALAWVSWPVGYAPVGGEESSNSSGSVVAPRAWLNSFDGAGLLPNIESFRVEVGLDQLDGVGAKYIGGWVCSKPARFFEIESGTCEEAGLRTVESVQDCEAAARLLNLVDAPALSQQFTAESLAGCYYKVRSAWRSSPYDTRLTFRKGGRSNLSREGNGSMPYLYGLIQMCMPAPPANNTEYDQNVSIFAGATANGNSTEEKRTSSGEDQTNNVAILLRISCAVGYCAIVLVAFLNWKLIQNAGRRALDVLRRTFRRFAAKPSRRDSSALEALVTSTMARRRAVLAWVAAAAILSWHLYLLTELAWEPMSPCGGQDLSSEAEILEGIRAHLGQVLTASAFLALQATEVCSGTWAIRVFAVSTFAQSFIEEATLGGHPILRQDRLWFGIFWRVLLGVSLDVPSMFGLIIARSAGTMVLYSSTIPDNMIPVHLETRCTELWSVDAVVKTVGGLDFMGRATVGSAAHWNLEDSLTNLQVLLKFVTSETTSVWAFATSEIFQCLVLILGLAAVGHVMAEEIRTAARVQNSQSNSTAVSNILDKLCDAVVTVDSKFAISKSAPRLAGLLAIPPRTSLVGVDLRGRMPPEDAARLTACIEGGLESVDGATEPLSLSMVDSLAIRVPCEVFLAEFRDFGMARNYVIGINEVGERDQNASASSAGSKSILSKALTMPPLQEHVREPSETGSASEDSSSSAGSLSECTFSTMTSGSVTLDFKYLDGEIVAVSPAFNALVCSNNAVGTNVFDVMGSKEKTSFSQWLQATAASFAHLPLPQLAVSKPIQLKLPLYGRSQSSAGGAHEQRRTHRKQWCLLAVTFPELPSQDGTTQPLGGYVLNMEITKVSGQHVQPSAGNETGFLSRETKPRTLPKEGGCEATVLGRPVIAL